MFSSSLTALFWTNMNTVPAIALLLEKTRSPTTVILDEYAFTAEILLPVKLHPLTCSEEL